MPLHGFSIDSSRLMACVLALGHVAGLRLARLVADIIARWGLAGDLAAFFARGLSLDDHDGSFLRSSSSPTSLISAACSSHSRFLRISQLVVRGLLLTRGFLVAQGLLPGLLVARGHLVARGLLPGLLVARVHLVAGMMMVG